MAATRSTPLVRLARFVQPVAWMLTTIYVVAGLAAMWLAPRVPYADAWRFLAHFLQTPFPFDILDPDNGHHEVLPNVVRVIDLRVFAAGQWFQVITGMLLAVATLALLWRGIRIMASPGARAAAVLAATLGLFWLGNIRALAHANESAHAYFVSLFLVLGIGALSQKKACACGVGSTVVAAACGLAAAFSFGSGIACFVAYMAVLIVRRARRRQWAVLVAGMVLALALLHWSGGSGAAAGFAPLFQAGVLLRWLAGPFVYAGWPLLDPSLAAQIPIGLVRGPARALATAYQDAFGPVMLARWPHLLIGLGGTFALVWQTARIRMQPAPGALLGIGIAWFAFAVGVMLALVRMQYLQIHPDQLLAPRYVVWSSLFWAGIGIASIGSTRRPQQALVVTTVVAILLLPSQVWMARLGAGMVRVANQTALAAAVGVVEPQLELGETDLADLTAALPLLHATQAAMFAWPESAWLGRKPPPGAVSMLVVAEVHATDVDNRLGTRGRRITFNFDRAAGPRLLLLDRDGIVRGMALRDGPTQWRGWMQDIPANGTLPQVAATR